VSRLGVASLRAAMNNDTFERVDAFARRHNITWSGALHELMRTHPLIGSALEALTCQISWLRRP